MILLILYGLHTSNDYDSLITPVFFVQSIPLFFKSLLISLCRRLTQAHVQLLNSS